MNSGLKRVAVVLSVILCIFVTWSVTWAEDEKSVLTIYFAGTKFSKDFQFGPDNDGDTYPELIAQLYKDDQSDEVTVSSSYEWWTWSHSANISSDAGPNYRAFINGVGVHKPLGLQCVLCAADGFSTGDGCRTYYVCLGEAKKAFEAFQEQENGYHLIVNLVGFSRGGVLTMMMADWLAAQYPDFNGKINVLAIDPVPGLVSGDAVGGLLYRGFDLDLSHVNQYVGIYAEDERTHHFEPMLPQIESTPERHMLCSLRGGHETLVGQPQDDGHPEKGASRSDPRLRNIYDITRLMAERLLTSPEWGNLSFANMEANGDDEEQKFKEYILEMNSYPVAKDDDRYGYEKIQDTTFSILGFSAYDYWHHYDYFDIRGFDLLSCVDTPIRNSRERNERLIYRWPYDFSNRSGDADIVFFLNQTSDEFRSYAYAATDADGGGDWEIVPEDVPIIESLYEKDSYGKKASEAWERIELLRGYPIPDTVPLPVIMHECSDSLEVVVPTATDNTDGQLLKLYGVLETEPSLTDLGTYNMTWVYTDSDGNRTTQTQEVIVQDTTPPEIVSIATSSSILWPPNHKMVKVTVEIHATDTCDQTLDVQLMSVTMNEGGLEDYRIMDDYTVMLRSERTGKALERVYTLHYSVMDASGNATSTSVDVIVPHDQRGRMAQKKK